MHVLVKPVAAMLAAAPFIGSAVEHQVTTAIRTNVVSAACEVRVFSAAEPSGPVLLAAAALADASATGNERVAASFCPTRADAL